MAWAGSWTPNIHQTRRAAKDYGWKAGKNSTDYCSTHCHSIATATTTPTAPAPQRP